MTAGSGGAPLIGRRVETARIDAMLDQAAAGAGGALFVVGAPGLGKTRLTEYAMARAASREMVAAVGRAWESGGAPAGWPFIEALRRWPDSDVLQTACESLGPQRAHLRYLHPELAGSTEGAGTEGLDASARFLLFDAVSSLWLQLARSRPCLLVLDDLHAADRLTLELLPMLCHRVREAPLLVLGTYRAREARQSTHARDPLAHAARGADLLPLTPLGDEDAVRVATEVMGGARLDGEALRRIVTASDGNPLFLKELTRTAQAGPHGTLSGLDHVIAAHVGAVSGPARAVAEAAAVFGRHVDVAVLRHLCRAALDLDDRTVSAAIDELAAQELLVAESGGELAFTHILVRDALYDRIEPTRREGLHASALPHLEELAAPASQLAHHALAAGPALPAARTIAAVRKAVDESNAALAFLDATHLLGRLIEVVRAHGWLDRRGRLELDLEHSLAEIHAGNVASGRDISERVAATAAELGDAELQGRAALAYGTEFTRGTRSQTMVTLLERALAAMGEEVTPLRVRVLGRYAAALYPSRDPEEPARAARAAIAHARQLGDPEALLEVLHYARLPLMFFHPVRELLPMDDETVALARRVASPARLLMTLLLSALARLVAGEIGEAEARVAEALQLAERASTPQQVVRLYLVTGMIAHRRGDFAEAQSWVQRALDCMDRGPVETPIPVVTLTRFAWARMRRDHKELDAIREELLVLLRPLPNGSAVLASYHAKRGELREARAALAKRDADLRGRPLAILVCVGEAAAVLGELELVAEIYELLRPFSDDAVAWGLMGFSVEGVAAGWLGRFAAALGRREEADRWFARAAERDAASGGRPALANLLEDYAAFLADFDRERADRTLDRAVALLRELGLHERAEALAARRATEAAPAPAPAVADGLDLRREGDAWVVRFGAERLSVRDSKGMRYLDALVRAAPREIHALELIAAEAGDEARAAMAGDAGPLLDAEAKAAYKERLRSLQEELAEAEDFGDPARADTLQAELEALMGELRRATGLGGRDRVAGSAAERARINVQRRLRAVTNALTRKHAALGEHLVRALHTGVFCRYDPPARS